MGRVEKGMIIEIPFKTPSVNHMYGHTRYGGFYLKKEGKDLRQAIIQLCERYDTCELQSCRLNVTIEIHEDWRFKKGGVRRVDIANREKFIVDSVFEGLGLDDKWIYELTLIKIQSEKEKTIIKINKLD